MTTAKTTRVSTASKAAVGKPKKVDIQKLSAKQLDALPEDVFLASLKPHARRFALAAFKLKGVL